MWGNKRVIPQARSRVPWPMGLVSWLMLGLGLALLLGGGLFWFIRDHAAFHIVAVRVYGAEHVPQAELIQLAADRRGDESVAHQCRGGPRADQTTPVDSGGIGAARLPQ